MARIVCIGEGMAELSRQGDCWRLGHGGDVLNTAIHLARAGHDVAFLTALGDDPISADLRNQWQAQGIDCSMVLTHPTRHAGLYAIHLDSAGERSFTYWRDASAAREMFGLAAIDEVMNSAERSDLIFFSLITLAILPAAGRARLLSFASLVRANGGMVAFDGNYRPGLWPSRSEAEAARDAAISVATFGLPTLEDETALSGETTADAVAGHWQGLGCPETVVKLGKHGCRLPDGSVVPPADTLDPVDTSGAGDAFNAGYLAARLAGLPVDDAANVGQALAGRVIMRAGAIPGVPEWPALLETASGGRR